MNRVMWLICGLISIWLALWRTIGDRWGWLGMLNAWAEWAVGALGLLAIGAALRRRWVHSAALLAFVAVGAEHYLSGIGLLRAPEAKEPAKGKVKAKTTLNSDEPPTFTIFGANLYKDNHDAAPHIALIRKHQPDVICLQELTPELADQFLAALADKYRFRAWGPKEGAYGFGVLSRFPVEQTGHWEKPGVKPWGQRTRFTVPNGQVIDIYNVHLVAPTGHSTLAKGMTWGFRAREEQVLLMQQEIKAHNVPAFIIGDCNFSDSSDAYRMACDGLKDSWMTAGQGTRWTWPTRAFPLKSIPWTPRLLRLDYCFHNKQLAPQAMQVLTARTGSDHCPLVVTFTVN